MESLWAKLRRLSSAEEQWQQQQRIWRNEKDLSIWNQFLLLKQLYDTEMKWMDEEKTKKRKAGDKQLPLPTGADEFVALVK